jgi:hypothetical protein
VSSSHPPPVPPSFSASEDGYLPRTPLLPRLSHFCFCLGFCLCVVVVTRRIDPDSHTACTVNCLPAPITAPVCLFVCLFVVWCGVLHTTPNTPHLDTRSHYPLPSSARLPHCSAKPLAFGPLPPPLLQATPTTTKNQQPRERLRARRSGQISEVAARCFFVCLCCCVVFVNTFFLVCVSRFRPS